MKAQKCEGSTEKPAETRWRKVERWEVNRVRSVHGPRQVIKSLTFVLSLLGLWESLLHSLVYFYSILNPQPGVKDLLSGNSVV